MIKGIGSVIDKFGILFVGYYVFAVIFYSVANLVSPTLGRDPLNRLRPLLRPFFWIALPVLRVPVMASL